MVFVTFLFEYVLKPIPNCLTESAHSFSSAGIRYLCCSPSQDGAKPLLSAPITCPSFTLSGETPAKFQNLHLNPVSSNTTLFIIYTNTFNWIHYMSSFETHTGLLTGFLLAKHKFISQEHTLPVILLCYSTLKYFVLLLIYYFFNGLRCPQHAREGKFWAHISLVRNQRTQRTAFSVIKLLQNDTMKTLILCFVTGCSLEFP